MKLFILFFALCFTMPSHAHTDQANYSAVLHELLHALPLIAVVPLAIWALNRFFDRKAGREKTKR